MVIYLPCRLGEEFVKKKFKDWENGKRVYVDGKTMTLTGFSQGLFYPDIHAAGAFISYDPSGEFGQEFIPKYKVSVPLGKTGKLVEMGFPGNRTVKLYGICVKGGKLMAQFVTTDRYEHLYYPIEDQLHYSLIDEQVVETDVKYCKVKQNSEQMTVFDVM